MVKIQKSILGRKVGLSEQNELVARGGYVAGGGDKPSIVYPSPDTVAYFDDFLGTKLDTGAAGVWRPILGTDTGGENLVSTLAGAGDTGSIVGGAAVIRVSNNFTLAGGGTGATTVAALVGTGKHYPADAGRLHLAARVRPNDTGANGSRVIFVGFSDDTGTVEFPIYNDTGTKSAASTSGDLTAIATNVVGWLCDAITDTGASQPTANRWTAVSADAGTVTTAPIQASKGAASRAWDVLEVDVDRDAGDTGGVARFYLNGVGVGEIASPVASTAKLTPWIGIAARTAGTDTGSSEMQMDWINVAVARDTGT